MTDQAAVPQQEANAVDPVCGMELHPHDAVATHEHEGRIYCFGHIKCKMLFERAPQQFLENGEPKAVASAVGESVDSRGRQTSGVPRYLPWMAAAGVVVACLAAWLVPDKQKPADVDPPAAPDITAEPAAVTAEVAETETENADDPTPPPGEDLQGATTRYGNGRRLLLAGKVTEAVAEFQASIELAPGFAQPHAALGAAYRRQGRNKVALTELLAFLEASPDGANNQEVRELLAEVMRTVGAARSSRRNSSSSKPASGRVPPAPNSTPEKEYALGNEQMEKGNLDGALAAYRRCVQLNPQFADAHAALALLYKRKGWHSMAADALMTYVWLSQTPGKTEQVRALQRDYGMPDAKPE